MDFTSLSLDLQDTYRTLFSMTPEKSSDYSFVTLWIKPLKCCKKVV